MDEIEADLLAFPADCVGLFTGQEWLHMLLPSCSSVSAACVPTDYIIAMSSANIRMAYAADLSRGARGARAGKQHRAGGQGADEE